MYLVKNLSTNSAVFDPDQPPIPPGDVKSLSEAEFHSSSVQFLIDHGMLRKVKPERAPSPAVPTRVEPAPVQEVAAVKEELVVEPSPAAKPAPKPKTPRRRRARKVVEDVDNPPDS